MPIHPDANYGASQLQNKFKLDDQHLLVREVFHTFQGEAPYTGESAVFLRTGGCNRGGKKESCAHFLQCDTDFLVGKSKVVSLENVYTSICICMSPRTELLVITGGEPLLQQAAIINLCKFLVQQKIDLTIQIESNVDLEINDELPKLATIIGSPKAWENDKPWASINKRNFDKVRYFRHLISADKTSPYHQVCPAVLEYCKQKDRTLYLSPITVYKNAVSAKEISKGWAGNAINKKATLKNYAFTSEYATDLLKQGVTVRLSTQSHLYFGIE